MLEITHSKYFWITGGSWKGLMKQCLSDLLSVHPNFHLCICLAIFLELFNQFFLNFGMALETQMKSCVTELDFPEKICLLSKLVKWTKNEPMKKQSYYFCHYFVIIFYWICSIMKIYIICSVTAQILYLGKYLFLKYEPSCSQPFRLQDFLINHISRTNQ